MNTSSAFPVSCLVCLPVHTNLIRPFQNTKPKKPPAQKYACAQSQGTWLVRTAKPGYKGHIYHNIICPTILSNPWALKLFPNPSGNVFIYLLETPNSRASSPFPDKGPSTKGKETAEKSLEFWFSKIFLSSPFPLLTVPHLVLSSRLG